MLNCRFVRLGRISIMFEKSALVCFSFAVCFICQCVGTSSTEGQNENLSSNFDKYVDSVLVHLNEDDWLAADALADKAGMDNLGPLGEIGSLKNYFEFKPIKPVKNRQRRSSRKKPKIASSYAISILRNDSRVVQLFCENENVRVKRDFWEEITEMMLGDDESVTPKQIAAGESRNYTWNDQYYKYQWYLNGRSKTGFDMGVRDAWKKGYTGRGVVVTILDDGVQRTHADLAENYDPEASTDINDRDSDPMPKDNDDNKHGTRCAGTVAAVAGNGLCGAGVAYHASIGGVRMLDGRVTDSVEARSLIFNPQHVDIYSSSWGPKDDGKIFEGPGKFATKAFAAGAAEGRQGLGSIFVWASGNGGSEFDSCACDGYTNSIFTISISAATYDNDKPWYAEECPGVLASVYGSGDKRRHPKIVTTDMPDTCTLSHTGTSASAPIASGIIALALEANGNLTWRDVQHVIVKTSYPTPLLLNTGWVKNGMNRYVSNKFGYGLMDAEKMVDLAEKWINVPEQHNCTEHYVGHVNSNGNSQLWDGKFSANYSIVGTGCQEPNYVRYIEHIHVSVSVTYTRRGELTLDLISPAGTRSKLLPYRYLDRNKEGIHQWKFLSVQQWGEDPRGLWTLVAENQESDRHYGALHKCSLTFYGTSELPPVQT